LFSQFDCGDIGDPKKSGMRDPPDLLNDRFINLPLSMAVDIDPEGGNPIQIPSPMNIFEIRPPALFDDKRWYLCIFLHLREGVPEQGLIDLFKMSSMRVDRIFFHH
jgi:hypothetical protein